MLNTLLSLSALPFIFTGGYSSYTSWSTSLNLLFFYITWSTLLFSHPPIKIELVGTLIIRILFFWLPAIIFLLFDSALPSLAANIKLQGKEGLGKTKGGEYAIERLKIVAWAGFNTILGIAVQGAVEYGFTKVLKRKSALRISSKLPLPGEILWDVSRGVLVREVLTYYLHRHLLHQSPAPTSTRSRVKSSLSPATRIPLLASLHLQWSHHLNAPLSFSAHSDHPICHLLTRTLPLYLPAILFRFHLLTYFIFLALISLEEVVTYSGYSIFHYSILGGATRRVDRHYQSCCTPSVRTLISRLSGRATAAVTGEEEKDAIDRIGNFGIWGALDWLHGTSVGRSEDEQLEQELADEREEVGDMVREVMEKVVEKRRGRSSVGVERRAGSMGSGASRRRERERERERD